MMKIVFVLASAMLLISCSGLRPGSELLPVRNGDYYGYINKSGRPVIPLQYSRAGCFEGGLAVVASADQSPRWGYIDHNGNAVIKPVFTAATSFAGGLAWVVPKGGAPQAIDKNGVVQFSMPDAENVENFSEGLAAFSVLGLNAELWGFVNKKGKVVIPPSYRSASYFSSGLCAVMNSNGKWGYIDERGKVVVQFLWDNAHPFERDRAKVLTYSGWGVINKAGKFVLPARYEDVDIDGADRYLVRHNKRWGWVTGYGSAVIAPNFEDAYPYFGNKFAAVNEGGKWGFINEGGKFVIAPQYDFAFGFRDGLAVVEQNDRYGFINESGRLVIQPVYDHVPVDYFVRYFARSSAFYRVSTDVNNPRTIAYKWLSAFYGLDHEAARKYSTEDTRLLLDRFASAVDMISDSTRQHMNSVMIGIKGVRVSGNRAIVGYTLSDNRMREQMLFLVKDNGKWLVQFSKNDEEEETYDNEEPGG
jgi:hypothetical protein